MINPVISAATKLCREMVRDHKRLSRQLDKRLGSRGGDALSAREMAPLYKIERDLRRLHKVIDTICTLDEDAYMRIILD